MSGRVADDTGPHSTCRILGDADIAALSEPQRRELVRRLRGPRRIRRTTAESERVLHRVRLTLMVGGTIAMIPWLVYLGLTLPANYTAQHWALAWIGFDTLLVVMMATTAYLGWRRRASLVLPAFGTGLLLLVDCWFDIVTANRNDFWMSLAIGVLAELPLAVILVSSALMLFRHLMLSNPLHDTTVSAWRTPLPR